jgi:hypothetical protein
MLGAVIALSVRSQVLAMAAYWPESMTSRNADSMAVPSLGSDLGNAMPARARVWLAPACSNWLGVLRSR